MDVRLGDRIVYLRDGQYRTRTVHAVARGNEVKVIVKQNGDYVHVPFEDVKTIIMGDRHASKSVG